MGQGGGGGGSSTVYGDLGKRPRISLAIGVDLVACAQKSPLFSFFHGSLLLVWAR